MTRINAGIKPAELSNKMLFAEYREIKRIPNKVKAGKYNFKNPAPKEFTLNTGHENFFRDKILYLKNKSDKLYQECLKRGMDVQDYSECYQNIPEHLYNDWQETKERINNRLKEAKNPIKFYDKIVSLQQALIK